MDDINEIKSAEEDIRQFVDGLNNIVTPMIYNNIEQENRFIKNVLNTQNTERLVFENYKMIYDMRQRLIAKILSNKITFYNSYSEIITGQEIKSKNLIISSILASFCLFLLFVIIRK